MTEYGTPDEILAGRPEVSFYCTSCRRCDLACPLDLSPSAALFEAKERLIRDGQAPLPVKKALDGARGFAKAGHGFPFSFYGKARTVFWPGCALAANRPDLIGKIRNALKARLRRKIGLALDCCYDPVYGLGDTQTARVALQDINKHLHDHGVKQLITGCLNCYKLLSGHLEEIEVVFILDVLPAELFEKHWPQAAYLHHPCPSSRWNDLMTKANGAFRQLPISAADTQFGSSESPAALCCGNGGGVSASAPRLADRFLNQIIEKAEEGTIVTYCFGCRNRFMNRGVKSIHLLEGLSGRAPGGKVASMPAQWANRFMLAMTARIKTVKFLVGILIVSLVLGGVYLTQQNVFSAEALTTLLGRYPVAAPLIFLCIYAVAPSLFLPSIPLTLAAGFFWGPVWGVIFSISGATIGSCLPFFLSRYLFQNAVKAKVPEERWDWLQDKVARHGWKAVAFTRLIPVFPFNLLNYLFGLTPIPFRHYLWSTFIFMLPACVAFVAFGSSLGELILRGNVRGLIIGFVIAVLAFLIPFAIRPFFRKVGDNQDETPNK
ncbi:MAG TPA: VTT domain-containing protein [Smithellaceae bacterium]|nr:VTT domain-containing protein [Smithellaceae bacterium]